ncbi:Protein CLEC16A [Quillaja saponaria]|uniref:Protein CLEC16A n=1 Tax=Quillaja saponaria TaxID=32244 RepID=A0AAD7VDH3_QUISA|nr:Protein CLEC16A [Quillaja saponaria]
MWRTFWRSIDRFSLQHFKFVIEELQNIKVVDKQNRELVIDLLQSVVEIVTYGDRQDPLIFECFMEYQVLAEFVRMLKISRDSKIEGPLLQYLSIMIQNMDSEHSIYYCFSNDYINNIISHEYEFDGGDLAPYFVSFLRAVSSKVNRDTLCLLVKVHGDAVVSFPLYSEALKFACHGEKMIQTAVRALTLKIYNISNDMVYKFMTAPPVSEYFSVLVNGLRDQCLRLDAVLHAIEERGTQLRSKELILESDKIVDDMYYFKDILSVGEPRLSTLVTQNLLNSLVFPILFSVLNSNKKNGSDLSAITSLYIVSRLVQVVGGKCLINNVASAILYTFMISNGGVLSEECAFDGLDPWPNEVGRIFSSGSKSEGTESMKRILEDSMLSNSNATNCVEDKISVQRSGILAHVFSEDHILLLASLFLLLILTESKDLEYPLAPKIRLDRLQNKMVQNHDSSASEVVGGSILMRFIPETSYDQSCECLRKELDGIWFDYIPEILRNEWEICKRALEQSSLHKDPIFTLELSLHKLSTNGDTTSYFAWKRMVDTVKVFILHIQLKTFISKGELGENPLHNMMSSPPVDSRTIHASDVSSASFGSDVSLESGIPCKIAFSSAGIRDIYLIPVACGMTGKLLLTEKHPFRSRRGVVIALAPLAGLSPKIDENHPSWLHLRIRELEPRFGRSTDRGSQLKMSSVTDGRWTLGFPNAKSCEAAHMIILFEINKQRSFVENILSPLLQKDNLENFADIQHDKSCEDEGL